MSLLADAYPAERRGRAIGLIGASTALGGGLGIGLGGWLVPLIGWRHVFLAYGAAGLVAIPLLLVMIEPARAHDHATEVHDPPLRIVGDALGDVRLMSIWFTGMVMLTAATGWLTWAPTYFVRELNFDLGQTGVVFGFAQLFGGVAGSLAGGRLGDSFRKKGYAAQLQVSALAAAVSAPIVGVSLMHDVPHWVLMVAAALGPFAIFASLPNLQSMVAEIVPPKRLGLTFAVHMLFLAGIGSALGPFLVGWASDATGSLRTALFVPLIAAALSAVGAVIAERIVRSRAPKAVA
jgi:MFS family permease